MNITRITVIFTCFNRKEKSVACVDSLIKGNPTIDFRFIVVDDGSTDGTSEALSILAPNIHIIQGDGNLYWCGGMRVGIEYFQNNCLIESDYCLLVNDDVEFYPHAVENMLKRLAGRENYVVVGATCNDSGDFTYGLKSREKWYKKNITRRIYPSKEEVLGETFNANAVLLPTSIVRDNGNLDKAYTHSLGDYDYGFRLSRRGIRLISTADYIGVCNGNSSASSWHDPSLPRRERIKKKESVKGSPFKEWWHFLYVNFGLHSAIIYSLLPYFKIIFGKRA